MNVILFDSNPAHYYPLSFTRPISYFRVGVFTIKEKWEKYYNTVSVRTADYLLTKFPLQKSQDNLWINAKILPNKALVTELKNLRSGESLINKGEIIAFRNSVFDTQRLNKIDSNVSFDSINNICDIFQLNGQEIKNDFELMFSTKSKLEWMGNVSDLEQIKEKNIKIGCYPIYIEEGARLNHCILNATDGPIYIGKEAEIMEGSMVRGPFAMLNNSVLKMGSKIYGGTTIGPYSKVGGEVNNVVFFGYSSKAHDGFLGNSIIGEWCNLGADTNNSNLKNNYSEVKLWNYDLEIFQNTHLQFCGLIMGDHSKCSINTMFNTGTVVGVNANIFGSGFPSSFIPSFSWGGSDFSIYKLPKALSVAEKVCARRNVNFDQIDKDILSHIFDITKRYRKD